ncbi:hypothetical protein ACED44_15820 [Vibrio splendidus]|uniref:hypothetical protein n=1 Tax=Vibrio splendidus TaxID=29497 RepID=UPI00352EDF57
MKSFFLITNYNNHIPQFTHETNGLDLDILKSMLDKEYHVEVIILDELAHRLLNDSIEVKDNFFFFTSSQIEVYKMAILDIAFEIQSLGGVLLPKYEFYLSHENKFHQELYKKRKNVSTPTSRILTNSNNISEVKFPSVVKGYAGFGSSGVTLVKDKKELHTAVRRNMTSYVLNNFNLKEILKSAIKSFFRYRGLYPTKLGRVVVQDFVPELKYDWKILVFGTEIFALKRFVKGDDFKASGSGIFDFDEVPSDSLLKFSLDTRQKLDTPFVSLDVAESKDGDFKIIEYQSVHFGLVTALKCNRYYSFENDIFVENKTSIDSIEIFFYNAMNNYLQDLGIKNV